MGSILSYSQRIVSLVILFLLIGQIMLFSATAIMGIDRHGTEFYFVTRQSIAAIVGIMIMLVLSRVRYQLWQKLAFLLMLGQIALMAAAVLTHLGHNAMGASRWLRIGPLQFQPSELAKITLTFYIAQILANISKLKKNPKAWFLHGVMILTLLFLIFRAPDLGSTILLCSTLIALLLIAGLRFSYVISAIGIGLGLALYAMLTSEYRRRRVMAFMNPWADPQGSGFQTIQSFLSFYSGKIFGVGMGNGNSKLFFLPEVHTDFIFSLIGEEVGFVGTISILLLFLYLGYILFKISLKAPDNFGKFLGFGLTISLLLQVSVNLGGVTGLLPVKGLPLPFISWGRTALIVNLAMVGILLNISRQSTILPTQVTSGGLQ